MFKQIAVTAAASALVFASAAQASAASLSLRNAAPATRTATAPAQKHSNLVPGSPAFLLGAVLGVLVVLEVTGAINIIGDDDEADSN